MNTIENSICDAIQIIVDRAVAQANYDKTIQGTIVRCQDATIGKYTVRYQDSLFYAFSSSSEVKYKDGATVYVLVPANDMGKQKTIVGTTEKLGINYIAVAQGDQAYQYVGNNAILGTVQSDPFLNNKGQFMLSSYQQNDEGDNRHVYTLYQAQLDEENNIVEKINKLDIDIDNTISYMANSTSLICGAYIRTSLENKQQQKGDYGILFRLGFYDNATQKIVIRPYVLNVDKMIGNPYKFTSSVRQYAIFDIDGSNFRYIESISLFQYDFPYSKKTEDIRNPEDYDIFFSNFQFYGANRLSEEEISTYALLLHTPRGTIFSATDAGAATRTIQAQVRVKGKTVTTQNLPFYWFIEDAGVASDSAYYCQYGGRGWKCLNQSNQVQTDPPLYQWVPSSSIFTITKNEALAEYTKIKCAVVYDNTVISKQITIKNAAGIKLEIVSDLGTDFYYDTGTPTLKCLVNNEENIIVNEDGTRSIKDYIYTWSVTSNTNDFSLLVKEEDLEANQQANNNYNKKVKQISDLQNQIAQERVLKTSGQLQLDTLKAQLAELDQLARETTINTVDTRVDLNLLDKLNVGCITKYMTFKCSVRTISGRYIGTASLNISNSLQQKQGYTLVINNGVESFKYNEAGVAPTSPTLINPMVIPELSFTIYDDLGRQIDSAAAAQADISWQVPCVNTMFKQANGQTLQQNENGYVTIQQPNLVYTIKDRYNISYKRNNIKLFVNYKGIVLNASTDFTFIKQGDPGTNGTDYIFKIEPNVVNGEVPYYPTMFVNGNSRQVLGFNWNQVGNLTGGAWFKVCLYHNNELIWYSGDGTNLVRTTWSILANRYFSGTTDVSMLRITSQNNSTGVANFAFNNSWDTSLAGSRRGPANILKCQGSYNGVTYYATLPVNICLVYDENYRAWVKEYTGFNYAIYTTDGRRPSYDNTEPFTLTVTEKYENVNEDVTNTQVEGHKLSYSWDLLGSIANSSGGSVSWNDNATILQQNDRDISGYRYSVKPKDDYRSECVTNVVKCTITRDDSGQVVARVFAPVHTMLNRYGNARLNGWDGNSISINNDQGFILAPQVGAGKKESNNSFTGVLMGEVKSTESGSSKNQIGLLGYSSGRQSIFLDAETGNATFGISGEGQIKLVPGGTSTIAGWKINQSTLSSVNDSITINSAGTIYSNGKSSFSNGNNGFYLGADGVSLGAGSGVFSVDSNGYLKSQSGTIGGWNISDTQLFKNNIHIKSTGSIEGPRWKILDNGYAEFTNVKITGDSYESSLSWGSGKFQVYPDGSMYAYAGKIGGFTLGNGGLSNGSFSIMPDGGITAGSGFSVSAGGNLKAISGSVGGWNLSGNSLSGGGTTLNSNGTITCSNLIATNQGKIGSWNIDGSGLSGPGVHIYPSGISVQSILCNATSIQFPDRGSASLSQYLDALGTLDDQFDELDKQYRNLRGRIESLERIVNGTYSAWVPARTTHTQILGNDFTGYAEGVSIQIALRNG